MERTIDGYIEDYPETEQYDELLDSLFHKTNRLKKKLKQPIKKTKMNDEEQTCNGEECSIRNKKHPSHHGKQLRKI